MDNTEKTAEQKARVILDFFKNAFDAEKAQFATTEEAEKLKPELPIKLTATNGRGVFYVSHMVFHETALTIPKSTTE